MALIQLEPVVAVRAPADRVDRQGKAAVQPPAAPRAVEERAVLAAAPEVERTMADPPEAPKEGRRAAVTVPLGPAADLPTAAADRRGLVGPRGAAGLPASAGLPAWEGLPASADLRGAADRRVTDLREPAAAGEHREADRREPADEAACPGPGEAEVPRVWMPAMIVAAAGPREHRALEGPAVRPRMPRPQAFPFGMRL